MTTAHDPHDEAPSEVTRAIAEMCDGALERLEPGQIRDGVSAVRDRLGEQGLRVVVAGRVSSGKSTLVNALLKRTIAATAPGEETNVVTWFRYGVPQRAEIVLAGGETRELPLIGGKLPQELGTPIEEIASVVVYLPDEVLKRLILIDTPGLSSVHEQHSDRTAPLLAMDVATRSAVAQADALVFLMSQTAREDDERAVSAFAEATSGLDASAARTIGVLSMADKVAGGDLDRARELAEGLATALRPKLSTIVPQVALLGESAEILTERDASNLERLAELGSEERRLALSDVGLFRELAATIPLEDRERLLRLLDLFGIAHCLDLIDAGQRGASTLAKALRKSSGVEELRMLLAETFEARADLLKAHAALSALDRLAWLSADTKTKAVLQSLRNDVERIRGLPQLHRLRELWAVEQAYQTTESMFESAAAIPEELKPDLARIASNGSTPTRLGLDEDASIDAMKDAALAGASRWQAFKVGGATSRRDSQIAEVLVRSYTLLWSDLEATRP